MVYQYLVAQGLTPKRAQELLSDRDKLTYLRRRMLGSKGEYKKLEKRTVRAPGVNTKRRFRALIHQRTLIIKEIDQLLRSLPSEQTATI